MSAPELRETLPTQIRSSVCSALKRLLREMQEKAELRVEHVLEALILKVDRHSLKSSPSPGKLCHPVRSMARS